MATKGVKLKGADLFIAPATVQYHRLADFLPLMTGGDYAALVKDIRANGLKDPIVCYEGKILDGRNRYLACRDALVEPRFEEFSGSDALAFVITANLRRRQLNDGQRALAGAKLATLRQGEKTANTAVAVSQREAADLVGISVDSIQRARIVLEKGTPALIEKVERGEVSVSRAAADLNKDRKKSSTTAELFGDVKFEGSRSAEKEFEFIIRIASAAIKNLEDLVLQATLNLKSFSPKKRKYGQAKYRASVEALVQGVRDQVVTIAPANQVKSCRPNTMGHH